MPTKPASAKYSKKKPASKNWLKRHQKPILLGFGFFLILSAGLLYGYIVTQSPQSVVRHIPVLAKPSPTPEPKTELNPLNGQLYTATEAQQFLNRRPMAVMVENHVHARPQAGLSQAEVIHEAMAEGGITRFMAMYLKNMPEHITPIRSARLHFVDWAAEYDAIYAHWGGSNEALQFLRSNSRPKDLDQFIFGQAFFRDYSTGRSLEHTGAASMESLRQVAQNQGWEQSSSFTPWSFKDDAEAGQRPQQQTVELDFLGTYGYTARFVYQPDSNSYLRFTAGQPHQDVNGQQLSASSIILLYQNVAGYTDSFGKPAVDVDTIGSGTAEVIQDGLVTQGKWRKTSRNSRTTLTDQKGQPIKITRGNTIWIISVPIGSPVRY